MVAKSDKLFSRRKTKRDLQRKKSTIRPKARVLIVSEGERTEVDYFEHLRASKNLTNIDLDICGKECGSSPIDVVNYAIYRAKGEGTPDQGGYEQVYCVFDRDSHSTFEKAKSKVLQANKPRSRFPSGSIKAIWSIPCFEIWLLLHFEYTRSPFVADGKDSPGEAVSRALAQHSDFSNFEKRLNPEQLTALDKRHSDALNNAARAQSDAIATGEENPSTLIHILIENLSK